MTMPADLPRWQLASIFPDPDHPSGFHPDFRTEREAVERVLAALEARFDELGVRSRETPPAAREARSVTEELLERSNDLATRLATLNAYLYGYVTTDAFDERAKAERSSLLPLYSRFGLLHTRLAAYLRGLDLDELTSGSSFLAAHRYPLERAQVEAAHLMGDEAEALASALEPTGAGAWARLHGDLVARTTIRVALPGREPEELGLAALRNLQSDPNREVRRAAYRAELELLEGNAVSFAAAMNSVKGEAGVLAGRRGWRDPLEEAVHRSGITMRSLEAMQRACGESFPAFRRYLRAKARFLGLDVLSWYDLLAPVSAGAERRFDWPAAADFVADAFASYSEELAAFARRATAEGWFDVPPRRGKRNGAFCMAVPGRRESRILLNFGGTLDDVFTLAHELGHAWHNDRKYRFERTAAQRTTPMTLAETASIFCETIVVNAMLERADAAERLAILEQDLLTGTQLILDIHSRFLFERGVLERRRERELSIDELNGLMLDAQAATYGPALAEGERNPLMWAHKGHYYGSSFYNYPYTFGFLFGLGLTAAYRRDPEAFRARYDELLASTGMADAGTLARGFGIDIEDEAFWRSSLAVAEERIDAYERLVDEVVAGRTDGSDAPVGSGR